MIRIILINFSFLVTNNEDIKATLIRSFNQKSLWLLTNERSSSSELEEATLSLESFGNHTENIKY